MASSSAGTPGAAYGCSSRHGSYATAANRQLTRQRSLPAALAAAFAPRGGGRERPRTRRLGDGGGGERALAPGGAVGAVARAMWAWIGRARRKVAAMGRSASSSAKIQYEHEEYAQNFDDGAAAREEPENLPRSFSARYARQAARDGARWGRHRPPP